MQYPKGILPSREEILCLYFYNTLPSCFLFHFRANLFGQVYSVRSNLEVFHRSWNVNKQNIENQESSVCSYYILFNDHYAFVWLLNPVWLFCGPLDYRLPGSSICGIPGKNTGVGCISFLWIFSTQGLNPGLLLNSRFFTTESPGKPLLLIKFWFIACYCG